MKWTVVAGGVFPLGVAITAARREWNSDESGRVLALEKAWNRALAEKDSKGQDLLRANSMVSVDIDGSIETKPECQASIKSQEYQPSQAVTEQSSVQVDGDSAAVVGVFCTRGTKKGKSQVRRERFVDTWVKANGTWQCVASTAVQLPVKPASD